MDDRLPASSHPVRYQSTLHFRQQADLHGGLVRYSFQEQEAEDQESVDLYNSSADHFPALYAVRSSMDNFARYSYDTTSWIRSVLSWLSKATKMLEEHRISDAFSHVQDRHISLPLPHGAPQTGHRDQKDDSG